MSGGGFRVSIPSNVKKTIQNIKEITGNHSDEEIYSMLKECSMDPNETTQRLLSQDPFHEVKRKRDRRKENSNNKESAESRWRSGTQGRGSRAGRGSFPPRNSGHDAGATKNSGFSKDNVMDPVSEKAAVQSYNSQTKNKEWNFAVSSASIMINGPANESGISSIPMKSGINLAEVGASEVDTKKISTVEVGIGNTQENATGGLGSSSAVSLSSSDSAVVASNASTLSCAAGVMDKVVGSRESSNECATDSCNLNAGSSQVGGSCIQGKMPSRTKGVLKDHLNKALQSSEASTHVGSSVSRPSSNYSSHSQQAIGPSKAVGSNKEWKPKPMSCSVGKMSGVVASEVHIINVEASALPNSLSVAVGSEEATSKLQKKLEDLHIAQRQHVIIPNHIQVPESERNKLSFGSFDASFGLTTLHTRDLGSDKSSTVLLESSQDLEEIVEDSVPSKPNTPDLTEDGDYSNHLSSPTLEPENASAQGDVSASAVPEYKETKQENTSTSGGHQYSVVHTPPNYSLGVPPMLGSQLATFENAESQARDASRIPSFIVQQPFDPANYYAQFYRSAPDADGRISPFASSGVASKYNGNLAGLPSQTSQSQEGVNYLALSSTGPSPLVTQAAGLMQSSIPLTQQPVPVFRPPAGMHISHYPPNFIPYGHYISPFYVPSPTIHHFLSNGAFPQQPQAGNLYSSPPTATTGVKFSVPQYKPGTNTVTSHVTIPSGYGAYSSSPAGYNVSSTVTAGNSMTNEDLAASQFKENNVYFTGQQTEGSAVWFAAPGREMPSLPASFYNLPQGQHVSFPSTQAVPGTFTSIYHPPQAAAAAVHPLLQHSQPMSGVDMIGSATNVYQQPQHTQINWPSNY